MIDLHTHTTASDGWNAPAELVARAKAAGVTVLAVTDHDTSAACEAAAAACAHAGLTFVSGIEITAVADDKDIHVLGYFIDPASTALQRFLATQRQLRVDRIRQMIDRLAALGMPIDSRPMLERATASGEQAIGRPWIARALVAAGHVATTKEAFDRWLAHGRPAFVPRVAATAAEVFERIHDAGGIASLAHPALVGRDDWIPQFAASGLDAIEAYHSEHDEQATRRYVSMADSLGLLVSGGSDYHGDPTHGPSAPGAIALPAAHYDRLLRFRAARVAGAQ